MADGELWRVIDQNNQDAIGRVRPVRQVTP